jgi:WD40 repeat protein
VFLSSRAVTSVAYSPCGKWITSGSLDKTVRIWDAASGTAVGSPLTVDAGVYGVQSVCFSPKDNVIAAGCNNGKIHLVDAVAGEVKSLLTGLGAPVTQLEFRDATTLVSASRDGTTRFWDVGSGAEQGQDAQGTHGEALAGERFAFSKSNSKEQVVGRFVVTAQGDLVRVYEVNEGVADKDEKKTPVAFFAAPSLIQSLACAGDKIAVGLSNGGVLHLCAAFLAAGG